MATALTTGQMKELASAMVEAIPSDLPSNIAQKWIGRKGELGNRIKEALLSQSDDLSVIGWRQVYKELGMDTQYETTQLDIQEQPNLWIVPVINGVTCNKVVAALRKLGVDVYLYADDLDSNVTKNDRDPAQGSYAIGFAKNREADEENQDKSANKLAEEGHKGITLLERLLLELGYFLATGSHLDEKRTTLCAGSRDRDGGVPGVRWFAVSRKVFVLWYSPDNHYEGLRSRSVVSVLS